MFGKRLWEGGLVSHDEDLEISGSEVLAIVSPSVEEGKAWFVFWFG